MEVWQTSNLRRLRLGEEKKERRRRTNHSMKIYMVSLLYRATINNPQPPPTPFSKWIWVSWLLQWLSSSTCSEREENFWWQQAQLFIHAGCPSSHPTNSVKALHETQTTDPQSTKTKLTARKTFEKEHCKILLAFKIFNTVDSYEAIFISWMEKSLFKKILNKIFLFKWVFAFCARQ